MKFSENVGMIPIKFPISCSFYSHEPMSHKFRLKLYENFVVTLYFHIYLFVCLESGGRFEFEFGLKFRYEVEFEFNLEGKLLSDVLGDLNKDTRRFFFGVYKFPVVHFFCSTLSFARPLESVSCPATA